MQLSQLQSFLTVAEVGSFTEAARLLNLSQSAVSRQIAALESEIGAGLFQRVHNTIALTAAGLYLRDNLTPLLPQLRDILEETRQVGAGERGRLRIGLLEDQCLDAAVSRALRRLNQNQISLRIQRLNFRELEGKLLSGEIDVAISIEHGAQAFSGCARKIYVLESMCLAIHRSCQPDGEITSSADLKKLGIPLLVPSLDSFPRSQYEALSSLTGRGWQGQQYDFSSIAPMVSAGLAATLANESHTLSVDASVLLLPLRDVPGIHKGIFYLEENPNSVISQLVNNL